MNWIFGGFIIFGFAAPSAVVGVPYAIGTQGIFLGIILCIICTISSALGSIMIAELSAIYDIRQFKDLGKVLIGTNGEIFATIIQNGNFLLFLPIALDLVASAAQGVIDPNFDVCTDYFILGTAGICLLSTQVRSLGNADIMAVFSLICVFLVGILIVIISFDKDNDDKQHAQLFLNPMSHTMKGAVETLLGITTAAWSYVPSFIIIELRESLKTRRNMFKAIILSAILNMMFYIVVGTSVVVNWGWEMEDPVTILSVWPAKSFLGKFVNALLFIANLVSYSLDSVPLTNKFVKAVNPFFDMKSWNFRTVTSFLLLSMIPWLLGLLIAIIAPNMFVLLAFTTAFTVPWVNMIFPGYCYLLHLKNPRQMIRKGMSVADSDDNNDNLLHNRLLKSGEKFIDEYSVEDDDGNGGLHELHLDTDEVNPLPSSFQWIALWCVLFGVIVFIICLLAALGKAIIPDLRGDSVIGCGDWTILNVGVDD